MNDNQPAKPGAEVRAGNMSIAAHKALNDPDPVPNEICRAMEMAGIAIQAMMGKLSCMQICVDSRTGDKRVVIQAVLPEDLQRVALGEEPPMAPLLMVPTEADLIAMGFEPMEKT